MHRHSREHVRREFFRARRRAALVWDRIFGQRSGERDEAEVEWRKHWIMHQSVDRKPCSCHLCGNPRRRGQGFEISTIRSDMAAESDILDAMEMDEPCSGSGADE